MSDSDGDVRSEMRQFVEENFLYLHPEIVLADGDQFVALGVLDSLGLVELVEEVQARYRVKVEDVEITEQNFGSIDALARYVEAKRPAA